MGYAWSFLILGRSTAPAVKLYGNTECFTCGTTDTVEQYYSQVKEKVHQVSFLNVWVEVISLYLLLASIEHILSHSLDKKAINTYNSL